METQDARVQHLTDLIQQLVTTSPLEVPPQSARLSIGKRQAPPHSVVDLVMDHGDLENTSQLPPMLLKDQGVKKRDTKDTPRQDLAGNISIKMERTDSPAPSDLSMSMMEPPVSQTEESLLWNGIHPPSEVYSPTAHPRAYRPGIGTSPISNLALHPNYQSSGRDFLGDYTIRSEDDGPDQSTAPYFGESNFSEAHHMRDIHAHHVGLQGFETHNRNAASPQEAEPEHAKGPSKDEPGTHQATPVDGSTPKI